MKDVAWGLSAFFNQNHSECTKKQRGWRLAVRSVDCTGLTCSGLSLRGKTSCPQSHSCRSNRSRPPPLLPPWYEIGLCAGPSWSRGWMFLVRIRQQRAYKLTIIVIITATILATFFRQRNRRTALCRADGSPRLCSCCWSCHFGRSGSLVSWLSVLILKLGLNLYYDLHYYFYLT